MVFRPTEIPDVVVIDVEPRGDERGFLARTYCEHELSDHGLVARMVQASTIFSPGRHTLRGLHYQDRPHWETKLVRCTAGAAFVVATDLRADSPTRLRWVGVELSARNRRLLYVPEGFAQGYQTLADETELFYQMSREYQPAAARGVRWDDPALAIKWPPAPQRIISDRDREWPLLQSSGKTPSPSVDTE
jgi:dTDP-4-dehydrorhamnose 3,5-epimerase